MKDKYRLPFRLMILSVILMQLALGRSVAQEIVVDRIIAVVGKNMILESEVESQYLQLKMQGSIEGSASSVKCMILQNMLRDNLLLNQAELDSIVVTDADVERSLDQRLRYFISSLVQKRNWKNITGSQSLRSRKNSGKW